MIKVFSLFCEQRVFLRRFNKRDITFATKFKMRRFLNENKHDLMLHKVDEQPKAQIQRFMDRT